MSHFEGPDHVRPEAAAHVARLPVAAAIAALSGYGASLLGVPLAWLLGALISTALISIVVRPVSVPPPLYKAGQMIVGNAVGLTVSADIVSELGAHALLAPVAAAVSIAVGRGLSPVLWRFGGVGRETAYFSLVRAGIAAWIRDAVPPPAEAAA